MSETPVAWTSRILLAGSLISAVFFAIGFVLSSLAQSQAGATASTLGVLAMLATPVAGLMTTIAETRVVQRQTALAALGVMAVLAVAVGVAIVAAKGG